MKCISFLSDDLGMSVNKKTVLKNGKDGKKNMNSY
jgi:hypothetical protein